MFQGKRSRLCSRMKDNCFVTETGCENLSAAVPRTVEEIEDTMRQGFTAFS